MSATEVLTRNDTLANIDYELLLQASEFRDDLDSLNLRITQQTTATKDTQYPAERIIFSDEYILPGSNAIAGFRYGLVEGEIFDDCGVRTNAPGDEIEIGEALRDWLFEDLLYLDKVAGWESLEGFQASGGVLSREIINNQLHAND